MQMMDLYMVECDYIIINTESGAYTASLSTYSDGGILEVTSPSTINTVMFILIHSDIKHNI